MKKLFSRKFDIDTKALQSGDVIPTTQLIDLFGMTPENKFWSLRVQALKDHIEQARRDIVCRSIDASLHILIDDDKPEYIIGQFGRHMNGIDKAVTYMTIRITHSNLTPERSAFVESSGRTMIAGKEALERAVERDARLSALIGLGDVPELPSGED